MFALKKCVFLRDNAFSTRFARSFRVMRMPKVQFGSPFLISKLSIVLSKTT